MAATPIGDDRDASQHLKDLLATADVVAAEDTRRLRALAARLGVHVAGRVVASHDFNERERAAGLVERARAGETVLVVSDAGMPLVSDPGFRVVRAAIEAGVELRVAPGPSAALAALAVSGLPTDRFCFEGFLSRKAGERAARLAELARERRTMVFFCSPRRAGEDLAEMARAFGPGRPAAVCRELTKTHQEVRRGGLGELAEWARDGLLGEVTVCVGGVPAPGAGGEALAAGVAEVLDRVGAGERLAAAAAQVAKATGLTRRELYEAALAARAE
ncbi:MAG: 16S rRNA (cytidine(1402)-2'-O)-methyltransferase [Bifidobacteriaceae bacterium]|nr:16S rRNA (cytidine(1402)-2'-O)-methyltransferase [Bifidobacteriaceae bacterium]